jgi:non-ribosomal peptide synthetase-like protein
MAAKLSWSMQDPRTGRRGQILTCNSIDNTIRWKEGERLDHLFEERCDLAHAAPDGKCEAVVTDDKIYTFRELDNRANQVARFLIEQGIEADDRVGLIFDKGVHTYIALLAVMKANAAYVPLDAGFPNERIAFILKDAGVKAILSMSAFLPKLKEFEVRHILLDESAAQIDAKPTERLGPHERAAPVSQLAYLIYTSGTTGTPKGVAIEHPSICNFVRVAAETYGMQPGDRCYQGMTIAFDFSVEELWVPLIAGATLVPGRAGTSLVGSDLADFLEQRRVTVMACVPTLLATIERDLPDLRILLVSGEACPHNLVVRWQRPGRTMLNAYGPTEATVTATLTELYPDKPVTIGGPLPTYSIVILDADEDKAVEHGGMGEIGIAGIGLAAGYLNRDDLTRKKFIPDFLNIPNNPSGRIYRTGDLGRINDQDEIEFHGRIDTQVKVRGYRIELTEIESVLMTLPQIAQAVVDVYEFEPGAPELVAYYSLKQGAAELAPAEISEALRKQLPPYMVPSYLERLPVIPMTPSNKADRKNLPAPKGPRVAASSAGYVAPRDDTEAALARALIGVMKVERVSVIDNFFQDLGAHSLLMARFAAEIRKTLDVSGVSMRDIYLNPTIEKLARHIGTLTAEAAGRQDAAVEQPREQALIPSDLSYVVCGGLQLLYYVAYAAFASWLAMAGFHWTYSAAGSMVDFYLRSAEFGVASFAILTGLPILAKWLLIGRWTEQVIPVWSPQYFRFWLVKNLIRSAPMALFVGTPLYSLYLRLLGANIGRGTVIATRLLPVCTDLISIGDRSIVRRDAVMLGYKAQANRIHTGRITLGHNVFVGEASVIDINTVMEDDTQLGHASSLHAGQRVPKGKHYHGSPAQETAADYCTLEPSDCSAFRRAAYTAVQMAALFGIAIPAVILLAYEIVPWLYGLTSAANFESAPWPTALRLAAETLGLSFALFFGVFVAGLLVVGIVPRVLSPLLMENRTYVLFGMHYFIHRLISAISNAPAYKLLFGDSSYVVHYLQWLGYRLNRIVQTGANFGLDERHDNPFLCDIGSGTMVSDGLTMMNLTMSASSFRLGKVRIGDHNYLGNNIFYPAASRAGANCLLGTKVMVPIDGPVRENVGLLGSPCFEIPRVVEQDKHSPEDARLRETRLREKNRYNLISMAGLLLGTWLFFFLFAYAALLTYLNFRQHEAVALFLFAVAASVAAIGWFAAMERGSIGFGRLTPMMVSMYDPKFWRHERHWKFCGSPLILMFKGTPLKNLISRLLGVTVGRKVFDDGCRFHDKTLVSVGDYTTLNEGCVMQGHSLEEGVFKCDTVAVGSGCTIGAAAFVHYGVTIGDNAVLEPDSFLMKGEIIGDNETWAGNPAKAGRAGAARNTPA